jgi:hypothetical protein
VDSHRGNAVTGGGLGLARRLPRGGAPASAARRPVCCPEQARTGNPPLRPREPATREQPAATTTRTTQASAPSHRQAQIWHLRGSVRSALPEPPDTMMGVASARTCQERCASLRDGLRPHLTEPLRQVAGRLEEGRVPPLAEVAKLGHHDIVTLVWWCSAGVLTVISAALYGAEVAILSAANPAARLPWVGRPANTPRSAEVLGFFALLSSIFAMNCVFDALGRRHLYDILWGVPLGLVGLVVMAVAQARHNRRVRSAA